MTFTVTYRAKDGALREERVEAASRAECVAECRRRGIAPTGIKDGGKGRDKARPSRANGQDARSPSQHRLTGKAAILAAVVLAVIAGGVWWWIGRDKVEPHKDVRPPKVAKPKAEKPAKAVREVAPAPVTTNAPVKPPKEIVKPVFMGKVPYEEMTDDQKMERARYLAQIALRDNKFGVDVQTADPNDKPMLTNAVHMSFIKYMQPGNMVPPPMLISDKEAYAACSMPVNYDPGDSEEVVLWKSQVEEQLKEMKAYMDAGHSAMEYYDLLDRRQQTEAATMNEARTTIYTLVREGKYEEAEETAEAFNKYLKEKGLPSIRLSPRVRHELKRRREAGGESK